MYTLKNAIRVASEKRKENLVSKVDLPGGSLQGGLGFTSEDRTIELKEGNWIVTCRYSETYVNEHTGRTFTEGEEETVQRYDNEGFYNFLFSEDLTLVEYKEIIDFLIESVKS